MYSTEQIRKLYDELDRQYNMDTSGLPIHIVNWREPTIACVRLQSVPGGIVPTRFEFNAFYAAKLAEPDWLDTYKHEYAHAAVTLLTHVNHGHDAVWKQYCHKLGCRPSPYAYDFNVISSETEAGDDCATVRCTRCGKTLRQKNDSKIVRVLKLGLSSLDFRCPHCGGMIFEIGD